MLLRRYSGQQPDSKERGLFSLRCLSVQHDPYSSAGKSASVYKTRVYGGAVKVTGWLEQPLLNLNKKNLPWRMYSKHVHLQNTVRNDITWSVQQMNLEKMSDVFEHHSRTKQSWEALYNREVADNYLQHNQLSCCCHYLNVSNWFCVCSSLRMQTQAGHTFIIIIVMARKPCITPCKERWARL